MTLAARVRSRLLDDGRDASLANVARALLGEGIVLGDADLTDLAGTIRDELAGAGPLEPLLAMPGVTDVLVNGSRGTWIDRGSGLEPVPPPFACDDDVRRLAQRLASQAGRRLDDAHPCVDARLPDGTRLHAVLPPVSGDGTLLSLRVPGRAALSLDDLVAAGSVHERLAPHLAALVLERRAFLITGGTGTGKTTVLNALLALVPHDERIVVVEDSTELRPEHPHCVRLQSRLPNVEGSGAVTMRDLVRQALRMRPDRIVVGEVRGGEVVDLLAALNTGHEGGCGTVHANSAADLPARLEALGLGAGIDRAALHALVLAGLDAVVHLERGGGGHRLVTGIHAIAPDPRGIAVTALRTRTGDPP